MTGPRSPASKILPRATLIETFARPRDRTLVFTNGCFDLLHRGHAEYLGAARALGDMLVVGINTDASVSRLKGAGRPILPESDRAFLIASLECVNAVTLFDEDTPRELIAALLPDVLAKGADYALDQVAGREEVEAAGGRVALIPLVNGRSTTTLLAEIRAHR